MSKKYCANRLKTKEITISIIGAIFILLGLIFNQWVIAILFSSDGRLANTTRIIIWVCEISFVAYGFALLYFRKNIKMIANSSLLFVAFLLCLLVSLEISLSLKESAVRINMPNPHGTGSFRLKPNFYYKDKEITIQTNSHGMRWREVSINNSAGRKRIAFAGDSFTFGCWVAQTKNTFVGIVDSQLDSKKFEILNFGVAGYGLDDIRLQVEEEMLKFRPAYIVVVFFNGNDFRDTYLGLNKYNIVDGLTEWSQANLDKKIPREFHKKGYIENRGFARLRSLRLLRGYASKVIGTLLSGKSSDFWYRDDFMSYTFWSQVNYPEVAIKAKGLSLKTLDDIRRICEFNNIKLIIISLPFREQIYAKKARDKYYDISLPQRYIEKYAANYSIPYLDLLLSLRSYIAGNHEDIYFGEDVHLNDRGHYVVGKLITSFLNSKVRF